MDDSQDAEAEPMDDWHFVLVVYVTAVLSFAAVVLIGTKF